MYDEALAKYEAAMAELDTGKKKGGKKPKGKGKGAKEAPATPVPVAPTAPEPEPELEEPELEGLSMVAASMKPVNGCYVFDLEVSHGLRHLRCLTISSLGGRRRHGRM